MGNLKHSLPGILFAIFIILIGLYGICISTDFTQNKTSADHYEHDINFEYHTDNHPADTILLPPIDTLPIAISKQQERKESNVPVMMKVLQMLSDGIAKNYPSHKDSSEIDSIK